MRSTLWQKAMMAGIGLALSAGLAMAQPAPGPGPQGPTMRRQGPPAAQQEQRYGPQRMGPRWQGQYGPQWQGQYGPRWQEQQEPQWQGRLGRAAGRPPQHRRARVQQRR